MLDLLELLNDGAPFPMQFDGDNQACIEIISSGKNATMRHFGRQHGIDLAFLHGHKVDNLFDLDYAVTDRQCADIFTKHCVDVSKWSRLLPQIGHFCRSSSPAPWQPKAKPEKQAAGSEEGGNEKE